MADLGAAFGFYPQMKPRRQGLPSDSANLPIDVLRGRLAGLLGAPADILNLLRSPQPTEMFGEVDYTPQMQVPYGTEQFLKELPLAPTSKIGQVAGQAASFVPLNPMPAVRGVQKVGQVVGEELAATMMGQRPNTMMSKVVPQPLFAVPPEQGLLSVKTEPIENLLQIKPQAPVSDIGFYSATEQAALNLGRNKGTGQSFINDIMKAPDVKKEELQFTGLEDFLTNKPNVTKQEVQDFLANNRVEVQEKQLAGSGDKSPVFSEFNPDENKYFVYTNDARLQGIYNTADEADAFVNKHNSSIPYGPSKYDKYQLAGGENYREILLTLPEAKPNPLLEIQQKTKRMEAMRELQNEFANAGDMEKAISFAAKADDLQASIKQLEKMPVTRQTENFQSSHFDQPNILAHMRVNDRIDADGKKMLLVEEIQSDWHQAGREKGYNDPKAQNQAQQQITALKEEHKRLGKLKEQAKTEEEKNAISQQRFDLMNQAQELAKTGQTGIPDAPFKDTWYQLALKRLTKYAADNGYERIGLTTGRQQADRFNLAESFDAMNYKKNKDGTYALGVKPKGEGIFQNDFGGTNLSNIPEKELPSIVGKELAQKIIAGEGRQAGNTSRYILEGIDLQVGGEGMKKYYDEIYPKFLDKYGKKYGAKVGETQITTGYARDADGIPAQRPSKETIRYLDITPQMKEGTSKGQPLFAATPAIPAAGLLDEEKRKEITSLLDY
jgi:hypothetical protein